MAAESVDALEVIASASGLRRTFSWRDHADLFAATLGINLLSLAMPLAILQVYDRIIPNAAHATLTMLVGGVLVAQLLEGILTLARFEVSGWTGSRIEFSLASAAVARLLATSLSDLDRTGAGAHLERLAALGQVKDMYGSQAALSLADWPFALIFLGMIGWLAGWLVAIPVALLALFGGVAVVLGLRMRRGLAASRAEDERRFNFILEILGGIHTIKGLGMETLIHRRYERLVDNCGRAIYRVMALGADAAGLAQSVGQATLVAVAAAGSLEVIDGSLTVGGLAACSLLANRALQPFPRTLGLWTRHQGMKLAAGRAAELFQSQPDRASADAVSTEAPSIATPSAGTGRIELDGLSIGYGAGQPEVLRAVSLTIEPGEAVAIGGRPGAGKTTLLHAIMGLVAPTAGQVRIDGIDPRTIPVEPMRSMVGYLAPEGVLFEGTILENLAMFRDGPYLDAARAAATRIGLDGIVGRLPHGYDTRVGEGAIEALPRGIAQRIAIARVLVNQPRILLFDAANAALDSRGDEIIRSLMAELKGQLTMVIVSYRPSLLRLADRFYEIVDGTLVEQPRPAAPAPQPVAARADSAGGAR